MTNGSRTRAARRPVVAARRRRGVPRPRGFPRRPASRSRGAACRSSRTAPRPRSTAALDSTLHRDEHGVLVPAAGRRRRTAPTTASTCGYAALLRRVAPRALSIYEGFVGARMADGAVEFRVGHLWLNDLGSLGSLAGGVFEFRQRRLMPEDGRFRVGRLRRPRAEHPRHRLRLARQEVRRLRGVRRRGCPAAFRRLRDGPERTPDRTVGRHREQLPSGRPEVLSLSGRRIQHPAARRAGRSGASRTSSATCA